MIEAQEAIVSEGDLRPNLAVLFGAGGAVALVSTMSLPWPVAIASTILRSRWRVNFTGGLS